MAAACRAGVKVSICTGRVSQASRSIIIDQLALDGYHIFADGAVVSDPSARDVVYEEPLSRECAREVVEFINSNDINLDMYSATQYFARRETWATRIRRDFFGLTPNIVDFNKLWQTERIIKGTVMVRSAEERAKADKFFRHFEGKLAFSWTKTPAYPDVDFVNVIDLGVSKGKALHALTDYLGLTTGQVMAIGDGENDVSLLSEAGLAVAMGNAVAGVRAVSDCTTLDVEQNGVAAAVQKYLLSSEPC